MSSEQSPPPVNIASALSGSMGEEASVLRPVSLRQKGPTLSLLGGRRKDSDPIRPVEIVNGTQETASHRRSTSGKNGARRSILRNPLTENSTGMNGDWGVNLAMKKSSEAPPAVSEIPNNNKNDSSEPEVGKRGSVRKRLSMLRLGGGGGKKGGGGRGLGSLDEE